MTASRKWKHSLLSSSFPLEYHAARLLSARHFSVQPDFMYRRVGSDSGKDFSVDLEASAFLPVGKPNDIDAVIYLLVECKHRNPNVTWLIAPDPNLGAGGVVHSPVFKLIDVFSPVRLERRPIWRFSLNLPAGWKAIEVNIHDGRVYNSEIRHGLFQLQFAIPRLIAQVVSRAFHHHPDDNMPFFLCPILLTTAELRLVHHGTTLDKVMAADDLSTFSDAVPLVRLFVPSGPELEEHCIRECTPLGALREREAFRSLQARAMVQPHGEFDSPDFVIKLLSQGALYVGSSDPFAEVIVCTLASFANLIGKLIRVAGASNRKRKSLP